AKGLSPYQILQSMAPTGCQVPKDLPVEVIFRLLFELMDEKCFRKRLPQYHDFSQAVELFKEAKRILIITGAGVSVSCGIPDFRSSTGIYATLKQKFPDLPQPTAMFDIDFFRRRPEPFFSFAK
ncbi:UNVERIFIED_CONTAM: NAD-dependent protein deacetylase sir-2.1, partial [Eudyptes robustus]